MKSYFRSLTYAFFLVNLAITNLTFGQGPATISFDISTRLFTPVGVAADKTVLFRSGDGQQGQPDAILYIHGTEKREIVLPSEAQIPLPKTSEKRDFNRFIESGDLLTRVFEATIENKTQFFIERYAASTKAFSYQIIPSVTSWNEIKDIFLANDNTAVITLAGSPLSGIGDKVMFLSTDGGFVVHQIPDGFWITETLFNRDGVVGGEVSNFDRKVFIASRQGLYVQDIYDAVLGVVDEKTLLLPGSLIDMVTGKRQKTNLLNGGIVSKFGVVEPHEFPTAAFYGVGFANPSKDLLGLFPSSFKVKLKEIFDLSDTGSVLVSWKIGKIESFALVSIPPINALEYSSRIQIKVGGKCARFFQNDGKDYIRNIDIIAASRSHIKSCPVSVKLTDATRKALKNAKILVGGSIAGKTDRRGRANLQLDIIPPSSIANEQYFEWDLKIVGPYRHKTLRPATATIHQRYKPV